MIKSTFNVIVNDGYHAKVEFIRFPGGEHHVRVGNPVAYEGDCDIRVVANIHDGEIMQLALLKDAIDRRFPGSTVDLYMAYTPYARQDRVACRGEAHSLKVFCTLINAMNFNKVVVEDPHSYVVEALLDRVEVVSQLRCLLGSVPELALKKYQAVVAPDVGAIKKAEEVANHLNVPLLVGQKRRDPKTGYLQYDSISGSLEGVRDVLIVDDICDGGTTFVLCAKAIHDINKETAVDLFVTHGIFSKGKSLEGIRDIYTYNPWRLS